MRAESFHRLAKALVDSGESSTLEAALNAVAGYGIRLRLPADATDSPAAQMIALTTINAASRSFMGNVWLEQPDASLSIPGYAGISLRSFADSLGVSEVPAAVAAKWPLITIGDAHIEPGAIAVWADGWRFGVGSKKSNGEPFAPACVAAAGLAVNEAFSVLRADNPYAGRRSVELDLWGLSGSADTLPPSVGEVCLQPLWLIGLGHLGQAYAWTLGFMPAPAGSIVLQDFDRVSESSISTSLLSHRRDVGSRKTRVVAQWLEARGFETAIVERRLDEHQRVAAGEPPTALLGVDNLAARRVIERCGFGLAIDAGLGAGYRDFRCLRMRAFPGPASADSLWASGPTDTSPSLGAAYQALIAEGADECGVTTLASRAVGAPFVGCFASGLVVAEVLRRQLGGRGLGFVDVNLRDASRIVLG